MKFLKLIGIRMLIRFESWRILNNSLCKFNKIDENNEVIKINKTLNLTKIIEAIDKPRRAFLEFVLIAKNTISKLVIIKKNFSKCSFFALLNSNKVKGNNVVNQVAV